MRDRLAQHSVTGKGSADLQICVTKICVTRRCGGGLRSLAGGDGRAGVPLLEDVRASRHVGRAPLRPGARLSGRPAQGSLVRLSTLNCAFVLLVGRIFRFYSFVPWHALADLGVALQVHVFDLDFRCRRAASPSPARLLAALSRMCAIFCTNDFVRGHDIYVGRPSFDEESGDTFCMLEPTLAATVADGCPKEQITHTVTGIFKFSFVVGTLPFLVKSFVELQSSEPHTGLRGLHLLRESKGL